MRRWIALIAVVVMVLTACGGDDGAGTDDAPVNTQGSSDDDSGGAELPTVDPGGDEGSGPSTASVTLNGETYEFSTEGAIVAQCRTDLFGIYSVQLPMADGGDGDITIVALLPDTDPAVVGEVNAVEINIGDDNWVADEEDLMFENSDKLEPGMSQVDSVEFDGRTVRGTATFFRQASLFVGDEVEVVTGTFEATCGEERIS